MAGSSKSRKVARPLMAAFRGAHEARDAKLRLDLRDEGGERIIAGRRSAGRGGLTEATLRRDVAQDLENLLNTINFESSFDLEGKDQVRRSVLNYGFPDVGHRSIDEASVSEITSEIEISLAGYEPRLAPGSVRAQRDTSVDAASLKMRFVVNADLRCEPLDVPVEFVAEVELDTGKITIARL